MKIGMNLLLWTDDMKDEMLPTLEMLKDAGYDGVEMPIFDLNPEKFATWGKRLDDLGLERTAVTCRGTADNPMSPDENIRALGVENNKRVIDCCAAAGVKMLVGPYHSALGDFSGKGPTEDEWKWAADSMREVAEHAGKNGVMLGLEYLNRFECYLINSVEDTLRFVDEVGHPHCQMMYDTFHANIEEKDPIQAIHDCAEHMVHVHVSENDRSTPGEGNIPWKKTFRALADVGYDGWIVIEAFGLALPALVAATKIWRRMFTSEEKLAREGYHFVKKSWAKASD